MKNKTKNQALWLALILLTVFVGYMWGVLPACFGRIPRAICQKIPPIGEVKKYHNLERSKKTTNWRGQNVHPI